MKAKSNVITFRVTPALARQIRTASRRDRQSRSTFLATLVARVLKGLKKGAPKDVKPMRRRASDVVARDFGNHEGPVN